MELATQVQILDNVVCISLCANALGICFSSAMVKSVGQTGFFCFGWATRLREGKL